MNGSFAFPRSAKIKNSDDFTSILRDQKTKALHADSLCTLLYRDCNAQEKCPRLGIIASKKKFPHAVTRNHLKRIARESFRHHRLQLKNLAILVLFNKNAKLAKRKNLRVALDNAFLKLK